MVLHFGVLPTDIIQALSATLEQSDIVNASKGLSFLRLPHPRTGVPSLFLPSPASASRKGKILEVQAVSPPDPRSWFVGEEVVDDGKLLILTPIDPTFLLLPILQAVQPSDGSLGTYRVADDIFEEAASKLQTSGKSEDATILDRDITRLGSLQCSKDALRNPKLLDYLRAKVSLLSAPNALEVSKSIIRGLAKDGLMEDGKENLLQVGRVRAACDLLSQYLPPNFRASLIESYNFAELDAHLQVALDEAAAAIAVDTKAGKKTKNKAAPVEEKKRKNVKGSLGVEKLKKANVTGMAKLSSFFKKT